MDSGKHVGLYAAGCYSLGVAAAQVYAHRGKSNGVDPLSVISNRCAGI